MNLVHLAFRRFIDGHTLKIGFTPLVRGTSEDVDLSTALLGVTDLEPALFVNRLEHD
jgi:hypothetical protein